MLLMKMLRLYASGVEIYTKHVLVSKKREPRNMKLPKKIRIGCFDYDVRFVDDLRDLQNNRLWGNHVPAEQKINIDKSIPSEQRVVAVLWHEILHALFDHFDIQENAKEEYLVDTLSQGITMVLKDNPTFRKYVLESLK